MGLTYDELEVIGDKVAETALKNFNGDNLPPIMKDVIKATWMSGHISGEINARRSLDCNSVLIGQSFISFGCTIYVGDYNDGTIIFKDEEAFKAKGDKPCYIAGDAFDEDCCCVIPMKGDNKLIDNGCYSTYNSIIRDVRNVVRNTIEDKDAENNEEFIEHIATLAFNEVGWQSISTYLNEMDIEEEYRLFRENDAQ